MRHVIDMDTIVRGAHLLPIYGHPVFPSDLATSKHWMLTSHFS